MQYDFVVGVMSALAIAKWCMSDSVALPSVDVVQVYKRVNQFTIY